MDHSDKAGSAPSSTEIFSKKKPGKTEKKVGRKKKNPGILWIFVHFPWNFMDEASSQTHPRIQTEQIHQSRLFFIPSWNSCSTTLGFHLNIPGKLPEPLDLFPLEGEQAKDVPTFIFWIMDKIRALGASSASWEEPRPQFSWNYPEFLWNSLEFPWDCPEFPWNYPEFPWDCPEFPWNCPEFPWNVKSALPV